MGNGSLSSALRRTPTALLQKHPCATLRLCPRGPYPHPLEPPGHAAPGEAVGGRDPPGAGGSTAIPAQSPAERGPESRGWARASVPLPNGEDSCGCSPGTACRCASSNPKWKTHTGFLPGKGTHQGDEVCTHKPAVSSQSKEIQKVDMRKSSSKGVSTAPSGAAGSSLSPVSSSAMSPHPQPLISDEHPTTAQAAPTAFSETKLPLAHHSGATGCPQPLLPDSFYTVFYPQIF